MPAVRLCTSVRVPGQTNRVTCVPPAVATAANTVPAGVPSGPGPGPARAARTAARRGLPDPSLTAAEREMFLP